MATQTTGPHETFAGYSTLETISCFRCGILFALPERMLDVARERGNFEIEFYCPHGHKQGYGDGQVDKLKRKLENERARSGRLASDLEQKSAQLTAQRGQTTRQRNRADRAEKLAGAGQCPVPGCRRHFKQLAAHMDRQHPDWHGSEHDHG